MRAAPLFAACLVAPACAPAPTPTAPPPGTPNVLLLSVDTLRADHLGGYGYQRATSPRLDAFARTAVVFDAAQATSSWTLPTLASIFTATYTTTHGCWDFASRLDDSFTTWAEALLAAGFDTACVVSHIYCTPSYGLPQGFVHVDDTLALPDVDPDLAVTSDRISDRGIRFLERKAGAPDGKPWFLWLHYFDPHSTYVEQAGFSEAFPPEEEPPGKPRLPAKMRPEVNRYDGEIAFTDHHVGRVLDALEANGQAERTVVVLVADHGEEFFDHGGWEHGHELWSELVRVPMAIRAPGLAPRRVGEPVSTVDLLPTLLDLLDLPPLPHASGRSLRPALEGGALEPRPALAELRLDPRHRFESVVEGRWKLIRRVGTSGGRLYDLAADPSEERNLAEEQPETLERLAATLDARLAEAQRLGERFEQAAPRDLSPGELDALQKLGYLGEEGGEEGP